MHWMRKNHGLIPRRGKTFSLLQSMLTDCLWADPFPYSVGVRALSLAVKQADP
jgi:hypothetical protein